MNWRKIATICALVALSVVGASAQTLIPYSWSPTWNTYVPAYIPDGFSTIIGNGGTQFPGSGNLSDYAGGNYFGENIYTYALPFPFRFINTDYPASSTTLQVSTNGYVSFPNGSSAGSANGTYYQYYSYYGLYYLSGPSYLGTTYPINSKVILAYVGNNALQLDQVGVEQADAVARNRGRLAAILVKPVSSLRMLWLALRGALGRLGETDQVTTFDFRRLVVDSVGKRRITVATDGEIVRMRPPLTFEVAPEPLMLMLPRAEDRVEVA